MAYRLSHIAYRISPHVSRITDHAPSLAVIAAVAFGAMYVLVAATRVVYPYDIDFLEDSVLMQSLRIANAQPVYVSLNADFVPHVYMPLYMWLGGLLFKLTGPSFAPLRLLSFGATLTTAVLIYQIARRESGLHWMAFACAGLFLGGYRVNGFWYELVRVDSLFVTLALAGFALGSDAGGSNRRLALSAILFALAFFTKQTAIIFVIGVAIHLLMVVGRRVGLFVSEFGVLAIVPVLLLHGSTNGWFTYYAFEIAASNPIEFGRIAHYVGLELFGVMAGLSLMAAIAALLGIRRAGSALLRERPWLIAILSAVLISGMGRASVGGNLNNLMPAYALLCLAPALLLREWNADRPTKDDGRRTNGPVRPSSFVLGLAWRRAELIAALIVIQFTLGAYNPLRYIPSQDVRQSGDRLIERIAATDGEVFVMMHPYYALLAGKLPSAQIAVVWHSRERGKLPLPDDLVNRIQSHYYAAIISDKSVFETDPALVELLEVNYVRSEALTTADAPPTLTGMVVRPQVVYVPRE